MLEVLATGCLAVAGVGLVMIVAAVISRVTKRLLRLSDEAVADPWFRKTDTSGLSWTIHWLKAGLVLMLGGGAAALLLDALA
jgi:hypothetical protein